MNLPRAIALVLLTLSPALVKAEDFLDDIGESLSVSLFDDQVRARLSGLADLEYYYFSGESPGLIFAEGHNLLNPRLSLFFDAQIGGQIYLFTQARLDRGFDPSDDKADVRLDEWAIRWTPWQDGRLSIQAGQFATIVGNYAQRHLSWDNPFVTAPLIYENLTAIYDTEAPVNQRAFLGGGEDEKYDYNPVVWGPSYASGLSVSGKLGDFDYAAEIKNAGLSSRPESWSITNRGFDHPTVSARVGLRPDLAWNLGVSASEGAYFTDDAAAGLPRGTGLGDYQEKVIAQDISFAWRHWQLWAEVYEARFEVPHVGNADALGYYLEAKYKFSPQWFGAVRWNQMLFDDVPNGEGSKQPWGHDMWRVDAAVTYRVTAHAQLKLQYSVQHESEADEAVSHLIATQFTVRF